MAATGIASRSTLLGPILRTARARNFVTPRARISVPNPNLSSVRFNTSSLRQTRIENSASRFLRRELSTHQPFYSAIAAACLVSKLPSDATASYEAKRFIAPKILGRFSEAICGVIPIVIAGRDCGLIVAAAAHVLHGHRRSFRL